MIHSNRKYSSSNLTQRLKFTTQKQRPRFLVIYGDDGSRHKSLLKGREDLRLDLRLMQFFQLVNHHIKSKVNIFTYTITPITKKCGLIQYVEGSDTIFSLITNYRTLHSSNIFIEQTIENSIASQNVDSLRPIQRVEVLREADQLTKDDDLLKMIWINSENSKILMEKTIMFSETSAVMSIVGYILGIGDRHPSNILLHRKSGKVIHIDFGDCFEAAKRRKFFPELIPFRLTRMMKRTFWSFSNWGKLQNYLWEDIEFIEKTRIFTYVSLGNFYFGANWRPVWKWS